MTILRVDNVGIVVTNRVRERDAKLSRDRSDVQRGSRTVQHWVVPDKIRRLIER